MRLTWLNKNFLWNAVQWELWRSSKFLYNMENLLMLSQILLLFVYMIVYMIVPKTLKTEKFSRNLIHRDIRIYKIMIELQIYMPSLAQPQIPVIFRFDFHIWTHIHIISLVIKYFLFEIWLAHWISNSHFLFDVSIAALLCFDFVQTTCCCCYLVFHW